MGCFCFQASNVVLTVGHTESLDSQRPGKLQVLLAPYFSPTTYKVLVSHHQGNWFLDTYSAFSFRSIFTFSTCICRGLQITGLGMNLATAATENKINKTNSMWFSGYRTFEKGKGRKRTNHVLSDFFHFTWHLKVKAP